MIPKRLKIIARVATYGIAGAITAAAVLRLIFFQGPILLREPAPDRGIVDLHCHTAGIGIGDSGCFVSEELRASYKFPIYLSAFGVDEEEVLEHGDALLLKRLSEKIRASRSVEKAVVLALDGVITKQGILDRKATQTYVPNDYLARETRKYDNLLFGASINPHRFDALDRLEKVLRDGAVLLKWIPSIMGIDPANSEFAPFYRRMAQAGLPLLTHTGQERSFLEAQDDLCDPARLRLPLELGVTVIASHAATQGKIGDEEVFDRLMPLLEEFPNLFADISSLTQINKLGHMARALREPRLKGRLVFGTDSPLQFFPMVSPWFQALHLTLREMWEVSRIESTWDRDVALKQMMGVPTKVFERGADLLRTK